MKSLCCTFETGESSARKCILIKLFLQGACRAGPLEVLAWAAGLGTTKACDANTQVSPGEEKSCHHFLLWYMPWKITWKQFHRQLWLGAIFPEQTQQGKDRPAGVSAGSCTWTEQVLEKPGSEAQAGSTCLQRRPSDHKVRVGPGR